MSSTSQSHPPEQLAPKIGIITALPEEYAAMRAFLPGGKDCCFEGEGGGLRYWVAEVESRLGGRHAVALTLLAGMGTNTATVRAQKLLHHFPTVDSIIMVGIAGGIPHPIKAEDHVRLGDVVVSGKEGVIQYDFGKETGKKEIIPRHPPRPPSPALLDAVHLLRASEISGEFQLIEYIKKSPQDKKWRRPPPKADMSLKHPRDPGRRPGEPRIFIGPIACANIVLKHRNKRERLRKKFGIKAVEMETSGIAEVTTDSEIGYLAVRGICDYCDKNKNDDWHYYAALVAAAYTTALLESMPGTKHEPEPVREEGEAVVPAFPKHTPRVYLKLPVTGPDLFGRDQELEALDQAWNGKETRVFSLVAMGGVGKTSLVNHWLNRMYEDGYRGAARVYGWSFYSQGASEDKQVSADAFLFDALDWFGDPDPAEGNPYQKGRRLAELIAKERTLLVLDGLEPLQFPPGPVKGKLKDSAVSTLLTQLVRMPHEGLTVVTTRLDIQDLTNFANPTVEQVPLDYLEPEAGAQLLERLGAVGSPKELLEASREFKGYALALTLLGSYLAVVHKGDIRKRNELPPLAEEEEQGGHARRVMESYEHWLRGRPELQILYLLGLFDRPVGPGPLKALLADPPIEGLTTDMPGFSQPEWCFAVRRLRDLRLLDEESEHAADILDCHPLVREHFGAKLRDKRPKAWQEAHSRLYEYYKALPKKEQPDTLEEMDPLFLAVAHGCKAELYQESLEVYYKRIKREELHYSSKTLGAYMSELAVLSYFFEQPWSHITSGINSRSKAFLLGEVGMRLQAVGRLKEAIEPSLAGIKAHNALQIWGNSARSTSNITMLYMSLGELNKARETITNAAPMPQIQDNFWPIQIVKSTRAYLLHTIGEYDTLDKLFYEIESHQKSYYKEYHFLFSLEGFWYCDYLLEKNKFQEVIKRAQWALKITKASHLILDLGLYKLLLGRSYLLGGSNLELAAYHINHAFDKLVAAGIQEFIVRGLLARAELFRIMDKNDKAWIDLNEAHDITERSGMRLYLTDYHMEATRLCLAEKKREDAQDHLDQAAKLVNETGYHRRDKEVAELKEKLAQA